MFIRRTAAAPAIRAVLYLAVLTSLTGALGLHPEPDIVAGSFPARVPAWGSALAKAASADCPICLAHRPVSLASPSGVVSEPEARHAVPALLEPDSPSPAAPRRHQGRAPPAV
jgi:hypothetical protein